MEPTRYSGVFREGRELYTVNARPGEKVYGETLRTVEGIEYRAWDPFRSKLAAYLLRDAPEPAPWDGARTALYLGGSHGTTVSHVGDLLPRGRVFIVEKSPTSFAPLLALSERRSNLFPMLVDAQLPERYQAEVGPVEFLYQDIAQRAQGAIFVENARVALARDGVGLLMLKVRSVTQRRTAGAIVRETRAELERGGLSVDAEIGLTPFSKEHVALLVGRS
ncbi:MAG: fibrillarin-like rRNA/tRNA 2'-O-methyltransferase [Thermoplasmata archaeon]